MVSEKSVTTSSIVAHDAPICSVVCARAGQFSDYAIIAEKNSHERLQATNLSHVAVCVAVEFTFESINNAREKARTEERV